MPVETCFVFVTRSAQYCDAFALSCDHYDLSPQVARRERHDFAEETSNSKGRQGIQIVADGVKGLTTAELLRLARGGSLDKEHVGPFDDGSGKG